MLFAHRRLMIIYLCLAGMEVAWFLPLWLLFYPGAPSPWRVYATMVIALLSWMILLEILSRTRVSLGQFYGIAIGLMTLTTVLALRFLLFEGRSLLDVRWMGEVFRSFNAAQKTPPALFLIVGNLFLWQRANSATSRDLTFFGVGTTFRLGMLLLIAGGGLYAHLRGQLLIPLLWLYFGLGLTATAVARVNDKALDSQSVGKPLTNPQLGQLLLAVGATVGGLIAAAQVYTQGSIRAFFGLFDPIWAPIKLVLAKLLLFLGRALNPFFLWLEAKLAGLLAGLGQETMGEMPALPMEGLTPGTEQTPPWFVTALGQALIALAIAVAVLIVIGWLVINLERVWRQRLREEDQEIVGEEPSFGGNIFARGAQALRDLTGLVRRFGVGQQLLAAVSVQNIYANLCRLAQHRGHGRRPAQPPDDYLPTLALAFSGQDEPLARITAAYMRVHYGERSLSLAELAEIRGDYHRIRRAEVGGG